MRQYSSFYRWVVLLLICGISGSIAAQEFHAVEKMYTHTDRPFYFPGEIIWFKTYAVDETNMPSAISDVLVTELISPAGDVVQTKRYYLNLGYAYGEFQLKKEWVGGIYTLRSYSQYMRNQGEESFFTKEITVQKVVVPQLLVEFEFDREAYGKGSMVSADYALEDLNNKPLAGADLIASLYLNGQVVAEQNLKTQADGKQKIGFRLPDDLNTLDAVVVVQASYQGVAESISRSIPVLLDKLDLQFMPEGGKLILGNLNRVAFKALDPFGRPADVSGSIVDETGKSIVPFSSYHDGMGSVLLNPATGKRYFAQIKKPFESDFLYELPKTVLMGAKLSMVKQEQGDLTFEVFTTAKLKGKLVLTTAAQQHLETRELSVEAGTTSLRIPVTRYARGMVKLQLKDRVGIILSERLVFINSEKGLQIHLKPDQERYLPREPVNLEISTTDAEGNPLSSNLSIAMVDNALLTLADDKQDRIDSYLLMSSELHGDIHEPAFYFDTKEPKQSEALDLIMLTHGWRDYLQNPVSKAKGLKYNPERKDIVYGRIENREGEPVAANVLVLDRNGKKILTFKTDAQGNFQFKPGAVNYYVVAAYTDDRQVLRINLDETLEQKYGNTDFIFNRNQPEKKTPEVKLNEPVSPLAQPLRERALDLSLSADQAALDEVVVVGYGVSERASAVGAVRVITSEELNGATGSAAQVLQGRAAGVQITGANGAANTQISIRGTASIRGDNNPLIILDGSPVSTGAGSNDFNLSQLDAAQIESVSVVKGAAATALYGTRGANGVILITTKNRNYGNNKTLFSQKYKNYSVTEVYDSNTTVELDQPMRFYMPVYDVKNQPEARTDFRKTLYWNPVVQTDAAGKASLRFYNSDALTSFKIIAEGVAATGRLGHAEQAYSVSKVLRMDVKLPAYASIGDTLQIPLRISNESSKAKSLSLDLQFTEELALLNASEVPDNLVLPANSFKVIELRFVPLKAGSSVQLSASVKGETGSDSFRETLSVVSPFFPVETSISDAKTGNYSFDIVNAVPGSLEGDFTLYVDVVGEAMNGVAGMISKPYGCFEQTSSATYPNVMVLQYLKATGKSSPSIEKQALDYIEEGYKRLISFETKEGGFEWFGKTPPHQTLTAFGVLEFTEMKAVYPGVNQEMLDRTLKWLLNQRDGKGGFHKSKKGYDSFASSPPLVANAYIVYALSEIGVTTEITAEYQQALKMALSSKDAYQMALMALAAHNFKDTESYNQLLELLVEQYESTGFEWKTDATITRSYGDAKYLETTAFVILALLRENQKIDLVTQGVKYLVRNRKRGTFGNTQTTVMCLKALLHYNQVQSAKALESDSYITLKLNERELDLKQVALKDGILRLDSIEKYLKPGSNTFSVLFSDAGLTYPFTFNCSWKSSLPENANETPVLLKTTMAELMVRKGDLARMEVAVQNTDTFGKGMITAIVGIPSGASVQAYQLKELMEEEQIAYYEVVDNYVVLYWRSIEASEIKRINLDLKTDVAGTYTAPASTVYPYYGEDFKFWTKGVELNIEN
ncbi:TonB-dependent receptor plug domain-containing protein [Leeuwenhoekiella nanhaiensis]|uniref:Alpha-2-macroglobulin domain-containing protein n=1 Tax=Leeuwenhoekiella nanhaiensis TaxID=1655491 RepID=A0A2G1VNQ3_9FLAO|nr:TonB-dependent receptor plug domain-containing protein [Leeuwenhoekiella nanhaiensis]PHQ28383.1 hypothetical protein CJ305_14795 [Leeuwenhoekiella nanhaiensis]